MDELSVKQMLEKVAEGSLSPDEALQSLRAKPFEDLGYAKLDHHRALRQGQGEVIYGAGKTPEQILGIAGALLARGQKRVLITRLSPEAASIVASGLELDYRAESRLGLIGGMPEADGMGKIIVACGGTSDLPVAEEAAAVCEFYGNETQRLYDVGVAGLHRLLTYTRDIMDAKVIVAVAGMDGALPSVIGGLVDCPVIAVPTSVGYGAAFGGVAALLTMLNSCASGVSVVNIDNGFGAGFLASRINHIGLR